ncbi:MAG: polysaccharide biosynthesis/export family protein [Chthoniobacterales bacterium]|jgi:polysaccharide export outer membrane protein
MRSVLFLAFGLVAGLSTSSRLLAQEVDFRPGDALELRIGGVPAEETQLITGTYTVDGEGSINLPHIGTIRAAGLTQAALQRAIEAAYKQKEIYTNPSITVMVPNIARFVNVSGDVRQPRRVEYTQDLTVLGAISAAGGFTEYADQRKVRLLRKGSSQLIDVKAVRGNPGLDVTLLPGDQIEVPQSWW